MRVSQFFLSTLKEAPAEAEVVSHQLMLRAGLIRRLTSGTYTWMPLGLRVLRQVEAVVREEMDHSGAIELFMPAVQPAELWQESGRWDQYGPELLRFSDRHEREFCFGPTHEEVVSDIVRREIRSYRQLPLNLYQIQTKFRDEIRPRFGVMRGREFLMKDAYSFHTDKTSLDATYQVMYDCYSRIFTRLGLQFRAVAADTGTIGGTGSHEFHVLADSGEDAIAYCPASDYAANVELAEAIVPDRARAAPAEPLMRVHTPAVRTITELCEFLGIEPHRTVKAVVVDSTEGRPVLLLLRGDHELNLVKAGKLDAVAKPVRFASREAVHAAFGADPGSLGPIGFSGTIVADRSVAAMSDFVTGANENDHHVKGVNFGRDLPECQVADLRNVVAGDPSPDRAGTLEICRGIEVGHIFQLRTKYSAAMGLTYLDEAGRSQVMEMGCYGVGVSRIVAAAIEQNHDERGIVFPAAMAPFEVAIVPIGAARSTETRLAAERLHEGLTAVGVTVLLDDRDERPGIMFADMDLVGIPHRIVVGERALKGGNVEYKGRRDTEAQLVPLTEAVQYLRSKMQNG